MHRRAAGRTLLAVVEGTGSYGAVLTEQLAAGGTAVVEAAAMQAAHRRGVAMTDALDAVRIARSVLGLSPEQLRWPRADGPRVAMRVLVVAREQMSTERTRAINGQTVIDVEAWFRRRTDIEDRIREAKLGTALRHLPFGSATINTVWM